MKIRQFWIDTIESAWKERSVIWLSGVRRSGKTSLSKMLAGVEYFDCELPRVRRMMLDPEGFLGEFQHQRIVLDEIHRLDDPAQLLKIAADHFPKVQVLATGSSTLAASAKFKDSLAGRKKEIWLTPAMSADMNAFGIKKLPQRLLNGGLPPFLLASAPPESDFQEWMDAYWAKDIQELFRLERRSSFLRFVELILAASGGIFEATRFARPCEVSRTTIANYLAVLEATYVAHVVRPFSTHRATEIVAAPKVFAFDTGFVCYYKGWSELRSEDIGILWEHFVLNEFHARLQSRRIHYWRDKQGHEVDFVIPLRSHGQTLIECKSTIDHFDPAGVRAFRAHYPDGPTYVVSPAVSRDFTKNYGSLKIRFVSLQSLIDELQGQKLLR